MSNFTLPNMPPNTAAFLPWLLLGLFAVGTLLYRIFRRPLRIEDTDQWGSLPAAVRGKNFELWCAELLRRNGFRSVRVSGRAGDQGADIVCRKGLRRYVIQCKCYTGKLGNKPVQEAHAAIKFFGNPLIELDQAVVMTNSTFTRDGKTAAQKCHVLLWDRETLRRMCK